MVSTSTNTNTSNNATNESVHLREISLCCSPVRADSEKGLLEIINTVTSPNFGLRCLRLIGLHLPLHAPDGCENHGFIRWSKLFVEPKFWNLEELDIRASNFDKDHVEWFLLFMKNIKRMKEADETRWKEKQAEREERKKQLELGLITLEDGEMEENNGDDAGVLRMKLKIIRLLGHSLSPEDQSDLIDKLRVIEPPVEVYL
ncbi:hypothetical protein BGZ96_000473 [Linnemannia gamsii]|uniref:Uncharacterized protein n=1 Tax=Linnemannia gamsii TaxID=64522 RepID=A0ABQ7JNZ3_9FUNG|nr:hypothetical protein BGZ96_000473 [Linnemannia gamsii]